MLEHCWNGCGAKVGAGELIGYGTGADVVQN